MLLHSVDGWLNFSRMTSWAEDKTMETGLTSTNHSQQKMLLGNTILHYLNEWLNIGWHVSSGAKLPQPRQCDAAAWHGEILSGYRTPRQRRKLTIKPSTISMKISEARKNMMRGSQFIYLGLSKILPEIYYISYTLFQNSRIHIIKSLIDADIVPKILWHKIAER
jgi:hypothetical protein